MSNAELNATVSIRLRSKEDTLLVRGDGFDVEFRDGEIIVYSGNVKHPEYTDVLVASASPAALKVGDVVQDGPNKGWIYCETEQGEGFLVAPKDSGVMKWREAMEFAAQEGSDLPNREQLHAIYEARNTGALKGTFNAIGSEPANWHWYWSATQGTLNARRSKFANWFWSAPQDDGAWCRRFSDGYQYFSSKSFRHSVRCVRKYSFG